jgi:hypothetical protein
MIDSNHDIVPTLRMFDGVMTGIAADEIERLRARVKELEAAQPAMDAPAQQERIGTVEIEDGRVRSYAFEQTDIPTGQYSLYTGPAPAAQGDDWNSFKASFAQRCNDADRYLAGTAQGDERAAFYVQDDGQPEYLDGIECQYCVRRKSDHKIIAHVFDRDDAYRISAALSRQPSAGDAESFDAWWKSKGWGDGRKLHHYMAKEAFEAGQRSAGDALPTMRAAFRTLESGGGGYRMVFKFRTIEQLQMADQEWLHSARAQRAAEGDSHE